MKQALTENTSMHTHTHTRTRTHTRMHTSHAILQVDPVSLAVSVALGKEQAGS